MKKEIKANTKDIWPQIKIQSLHNLRPVSQLDEDKTIPTPSEKESIGNSLIGSERWYPSPEGYQIFYLPKHIYLYLGRFLKLSSLYKKRDYYL